MSNTLKEFLRVSVKDEWVRVEIEVIVEDMLKQQNDKFKAKLTRWLDLLQTDGCNSKSMVMNDIQFLLKEIKESESGTTKQ